MNTKLIDYLNKNNIDLKLNKHNALEITDNNKFLNFMVSYPLSYNIDDEIKENKINNILLYKSYNKIYYSWGIKINIIKKDNLFKSIYYDLEPIIKLSENKYL